MEIINTKVIIVGKGISGLILSILLKRKGIENVVLERREVKQKPSLGETLPPTTLSLLESLHLKELFEKSSFKTFGYHSMWGNNQVVDNNFFFHNPHKHGLKINKTLLINDLEQLTKEEIVSFDTLSKVKHDTSEKVYVSVKQGRNMVGINGELLVDATGRNRAVLKKIGVDIEVYDDLLAHTCHLPYIKHAKLTHPVYVESFENGWGIVSSLDENTNSMTLFSEKGNSEFKKFNHYEGWKELLSNTHLLKDFLPDTYEGKIVGYQANSSKASEISGNNWLAIGDAAISFDPLSSHGISNAIYCCYLSSKMIESFFSKDLDEPLLKYENSLKQIFNTYLKHKSNLYAVEKRWENSSFWSKQHIIEMEN